MFLTSLESGLCAGGGHTSHAATAQSAFRQHSRYITQHAYSISCQIHLIIYLRSFTFAFVDSSLYTEDSGHSKKRGSLYMDLGALAGYYNLVRGPPSNEYG